MNFKLVICVTVAVLAGYLAVFQIVEHWRVATGPKRVPPPEPSFRTKVIKYHDEKGIEVERETRFQVSTKMADEETLRKLPPPPPSVPLE